MLLVDKLKTEHRDLWNKVVFHRFVNELGDGTLPTDIFGRYFLQDYVFVNDLVVLTSKGISKSPDFDSASVLNNFLTGILNPENDLFVRFFNELGYAEEQYSIATATPATQAFGDFLVRTGYEGNFDDIATVLYVTEGTYLDWGTRLTEERAEPDNSVYKEWIDLHNPSVLGDLVEWLGNYLNEKAQIDYARASYLFVTALRYEVLFWESAYAADQWFDLS